MSIRNENIEDSLKEFFLRKTFSKTLDKTMWYVVSVTGLAARFMSRVVRLRAVRLLRIVIDNIGLGCYYTSTYVSTTK